jgi:hypothetical protein
MQESNGGLADNMSLFGWTPGFVRLVPLSQKVVIFAHFGVIER